ncbi:MAG TPA: phosphatidylserine decarboxylase family protein [Williamwhitmania sp.]|nr:phosphatidylserine decarboxylase family protein [Williamwhitmania sp.]
MQIHKEGYGILRVLIFGLVVFNLLVILLLPLFVLYITALASLLMTLFTLRFFRVPTREVAYQEGVLIAPADGTVVAIEEVMENEYFHEPRRQVSIFMSVWNVHINWFPVSGKVDYFKHHHGKYLVAWHPKSSEENERTSVVVSIPTGKAILLRQIAGYVARRVVCYATVGNSIAAGDQMGFIKFGSRVDIFLPLDAQVEVTLNQKVVGTQTVIAKL